MGGFSNTIMLGKKWVLLNIVYIHFTSLKFSSVHVDFSSDLTLVVKALRSGEKHH